MIDFSEFHFLRPEWFLALIPLAILLYITLRLFKQQSGWQSILANHLYRHVISQSGSVKRRPPMSLLALGWLLAVVALAGPTWEQLPQPVYQLNTGKVVLIDMSMSMRSTDVKPNRLQRAKFKAIDLINKISEGDIGLVAYSGDAFTISPLSSDAQNLTTLLPSLTPEIMPVQGSEPFLGLTAASDLLKNAGYVEGEILWITDGIEMAQVAEVRELINELPYRVSVLGVGTSDGAPIQLTDGDFLKDATGAIVIPKLNGRLLSGLAQATGGRYSSITPDDRDLDHLVGQALISRETQQDEESDSENNGEQDDNFGDKWDEAGPYLILLLIPLAAFGFRKGYITLVCMVLLVGTIQPNKAMALEWEDLWKTKNQQASEAFQAEDYENAANTFDDPLWKGTALYKNEQYEEALAEFSKVDGVDSLYNQGNALAKMGKLDEAIDAYEQVLAQQPNHQDAEANKALLEELKQQQEQNQQQNSEQNDQNSPDQQQENQQQDGQNQQSENSDEQSESQDGQQQEQNQSNESQQNDQESENQQDPEQQQGDSEESNEQEETEEQQSESEQSEESESAQQTIQQAQESDEPLSDEEREQMQRMQNLLNKVPDDPAFLLKRKMMLENQQRRRETAPSQSKRNW